MIGETARESLSPDTLHALCLELYLEKQRVSQLPSFLEFEQLLWVLAVNSSQACEIACRVFGGLESPTCQITSDTADIEERVSKRVLPLLLNRSLPTKAELYNLWENWTEQHPTWPLSETLCVPFCFFIYRAEFLVNFNELRRRPSAQPVFRAWVGMEAGSVQSKESDMIRLQHFFGVMDQTLMRTVGRRLHRDRKESFGERHVDDTESLAIEGATSKVRRIEQESLRLLKTSGEALGLAIPKLPIRGMQAIDGSDGMWRAMANDLAYNFLIKLAPGLLGRFETALPDAAERAQQGEADSADAKKRGGSGGRKAKKRGTSEPRVVHIPIGFPQHGNKQELDPATLANPFPSPLMSEIPTPLDCLEAIEKKQQDKRLVDELFKTAIDRWGESGRKMLQAMQNGQTQLDAARAAGITPKAVRKRFHTLNQVSLKRPS